MLNTRSCLRTDRVALRHWPVWCQLLLLVVVCLSAGCDADSTRLSRRTASASDMPENVMSAAQAKLPDVEFTEFWKNVDKAGQLQSYEIRGRNKVGKIREVRVSPTGEILEVE